MITPIAVKHCLEIAVESLLSRVQTETKLRLPPQHLFVVRWRGLSHRLWDSTEVAERLIVDGCIPAIADIAIVGITESESLIEIMPSGRTWVRSLEETWGKDETGPFKPLKWSIPYRVLDQLECSEDQPTVEAFLQSGALLIEQFK